MNDITSKPFTQAQLTTILTRWSDERRDATAATDIASASAPSLDPQIIGGLRKTHLSLLTRLVRTYADFAPKAIASHEKALADASIDALRASAHSLKSSSANIGANRLSALCRDLETRLRMSSDWDGSANLAAVDAIRNEFASVAAELAALQLELAATAATSAPPPVADGKARG